MVIFTNNNDTYEHFLYLEDTARKINECKTKEEALNCINDAYQYIKYITPQYFKGYELVGGYKYLKYALIMCEKAMPNGFIMESIPNYQKDMMDLKVPLNADIKEKLDWIVFMTRRYLEAEARNINPQENFKNLDLGDYCKKSSKEVSKLCNMLGLKSRQIIINPGFCEYPELYEGNYYHYINMVIDGDKKYIIDCTYRQFFTTTYNNLDRIGIIDLSNCSPGIFMTMNDDRKELSKTLLKDGWFLCNPENIKNYFDGFVISYRNGLYYQITDDYSYTTKYTAKDYMRFINGHDNQVNHEHEEVLGYQRTLTPKNDIRFE